MLNQRRCKNLLLALAAFNIASLALVNFNLQAQLSPDNLLQVQIEQLQDQIDSIRQNLVSRPSIHPTGYSGCLDNGNSSPACLKKEQHKLPTINSPSNTPDNNKTKSLKNNNLAVRKKSKYLVNNQALPETTNQSGVSFTNHPFSEDFSVDLFTNLQIDYFAGRALELFNSNSYDDYIFTQGALDFGIDIAKLAGPRHHELFFDVRAKGIFGNSGIFNGTIPRPIKIGLGRTENSYAFQPALQNLWLRELWFKYNFNPDYHTDLQIGFFPYAIGSGLTLGNGYKVGKLIPGYYEERFVDQFRPGLMLTGDIWPERLKYKIYAGLRANNSSNFYDTAQFTYSQDPNARTHPERGSFFNSTVCALEIEYHSQHKNIQTDVRPYIIISQEQFQQVEFPGDASSTLGILGINLNAKNDRWSFSFESAVNFGAQHVQAWDRDFIEFVSKPTHQYLFQDFSTTTAFKPCWKLANNSPCPESVSYSKDNGQEFVDSNLIVYKNSYDRFRHAYQNSYHGLMFYTEVAHRKQHPTKLGTQTTFALAAGYASGDDNPNDSFEKLMANRLYGSCGDEDLDTCTIKNCLKDYNKKYQGFVGIDQMFMNRDVYSVFMLETQKLNRPLATNESRLTYPLFSNLAFIGFGAKYDQIVDQERAFTFRGNILTYWQPYQTKKGYNFGLDILFALGSCGQAATDCFTPLLEADAHKCLSKHLGSELNGAINYQFDQNLNFYLSGAIFLPGNYYRDAIGKKIPLEVQYQLASVDYSGYEMNQQKFDIGLSNSAALLFNIGFGYAFDTAPKQHAVFSPDLENSLATMAHGHTKSEHIKPTTTLKLTTKSAPVITPEPTKSLPVTDLELLEVLEYPKPVIAPVTLATNARTQAAQLPQVSAPTVYNINRQHLPSVLRSSSKSVTPANNTRANLSVLDLPVVTAPTTTTVSFKQLATLEYQQPIVTPSFAGTGCSKPASDLRATTKTGHRLVVGTTAPAISDPREPYGPRRSVLSANDAGRPVTAHGQRKNRKITVRPRTAVTAPIMVSTASARDFIGKAAAAEAATETMLRTEIHTAIDAYIALLKQNCQIDKVIKMGTLSSHEAN